MTTRRSFIFADIPKLDESNLCERCVKNARENPRCNLRLSMPGETLCYKHLGRGKNIVDERDRGVSVRVTASAGLPTLGKR